MKIHIVTSDRDYYSDGCMNEIGGQPDCYVWDKKIHVKYTMNCLLLHYRHWEAVISPSSALSFEHAHSDDANAAVWQVVINIRSKITISVMLTVKLRLNLLISVKHKEQLQLMDMPVVLQVFGHQKA